jgi:DNA-binding GntR family transcriptional regulator
MASSEGPAADSSGAAPAERTIQRRSLHKEVIEQLRDMIVEGELAPGEKIDEGLLCRQLGISRTPLREAIKVLASEDLIELRPNRGTRVSEITAEGVAELFEAVGGIERIAGELAAQRMTEANLERLTDLQQRMEALHDAGMRHEYFRLNQEVHNTIVALAGNSVLSTTHGNLMVRVRRARYTAILSQERWDESVREHAAILAALAARDSARAGELIFHHVAKTGAVVREAFDAGS